MKSIPLVFKDIVHFKGGDLEIIPSFEHVACIEAFSYKAFNVFVFCFYFLDFRLYLFFFSSDLIKTLNSVCHLVHVFRLILKFGHHIVNEIFDLFAFSLDRELDNLNEILDFFVNVNFQHIL